MIKALLEIERLNIIFVDWSDKAVEYSEAVANTRVVGAELAQVVNSLNVMKNLIIICIVFN